MARTIHTLLVPFNRSLIVGVAVATLLGVAGRCVAQTTVYNLADNWSDVNNPNGVWRLNKAPGTAFTTNQTDYWSNSTGQRAWAEQPYPQNAHVPFWMKVTTNALAGFASAGSLVMHTAETGRTGTELSSVAWTAPAGGTVLIAGSTWGHKDFSNRPQRWELLANGVSLTQGDLVFADAYTESAPFDFASGTSGASVLTRTVQSNDVIELRIYRQAGSPYGDLVGLNFSVSLTAIPEPASAALVAAGCALVCLCGVRIRRLRGGIVASPTEVGRS